MAFLRRFFFFTFCPILEASTWLLINVDFFILLARIVSMCSYSKVSKHKMHLLSDRNEGCSSYFRQLCINTLWPSKGYYLGNENANQPVLSTADLCLVCIKIKQVLHYVAHLESYLCYLMLYTVPVI